MADYRISETDVLSAVIERLKNGDFTVTADDEQEGFKRPTAFVGCFPATVERIYDMERVTDIIAIDFYPKNGTRVQCMKAAELIRDLFLYQALEVGDRVLTTYEMDFDLSRSASNGAQTFVLMCEFKYEYEQALGDEEEDYGTMQDLELGGI